jgi:hypothetical protein
MNSGQIFGAAVFVLGIALLGFGYNASEAPVDQVSNALTGNYSDRTMWMMIGGGVAIVVGVLMAMFGRRL